MPLKRTLSLTLVTFYGLGTILGAGIYALVGEVAKQAEEFTPLAFLIASVIAFFTAASYAELSSRFPQSAGSALYVRRAFDHAWLSGLIGWVVVLTGVISAATIAHGFANYIALFFPIPSYISITILILILGGLALWGIRESATLIMIMTIIEVGGILMIIVYGRSAFTPLNISQLTMPHSFDGVLLGAFIAFYAYIGFEDMVNTAEETIKPERTLPVAIFLAIASASILYLLIAWVIVATLPTDILAQSNIPLVKIIERQGQSPTLFTLIALVSITNGVAVQIIMASRLIYGMAKQENAPKLFSIVAERTQTPVYATLLVMFIILVFAYALPITTLAKLTSSIILCIFIMIHVSLIKIKLREKKKSGTFSLPIIFPIIAIGLTGAFLGMQFFLN
ncbi:amino acid transporter [Legionella lansingensis]|uniref:Amino acid transporter n=1 Tax=Legionella lansingensis TaxID=45067 RepID=A0A0W0VLI7_9GAMM|nr:amino acid permease [Legionella lansingensis]KTD20994.1 amino acid transporter [Legionella lansingensis]SNV44845.1 amino acid transporter [Legionella lansingensis]